MLNKYAIVPWMHLNAIASASFMLESRSNQIYHHLYKVETKFIWKKLKKRLPSIDCKMWKDWKVSFEKSTVSWLSNLMCSFMEARTRWNWKRTSEHFKTISDIFRTKSEFSVWLFKAFSKIIILICFDLKIKMKNCFKVSVKLLRQHSPIDRLTYTTVHNPKFYF